MRIPNWVSMVRSYCLILVDFGANVIIYPSHVTTYVAKTDMLFLSCTLVSITSALFRCDKISVKRGRDC